MFATPEPRPELGWAAAEQLRTGPAMPAVDVFAWSCVVAHLAGGVHPFASQSDQEWILPVQSAEPDLFGLPLRPAPGPRRGDPPDAGAQPARPAERTSTGHYLPAATAPRMALQSRPTTDEPGNAVLTDVLRREAAAPRRPPRRTRTPLAAGLCRDFAHVAISFADRANGVPANLRLAAAFND